MSVKHRRIVGEQRQTLAKDLVGRYTEGESIRALASSTGRSYGFVHQVLTESGVLLRQHGGDRGSSAEPVEGLVATLATRHPGQQLTKQQAEACLRAAHGSCAYLRAAAARRQHNEQVFSQRLRRLVSAEGGDYSG